MNQKLLWKLVLSVFALVLVCVILFSGLQILESTVFYGSREMEVSVRKTITKDGVDYFPRQDITTILVMGIDQAGPVRLSEEPNRGNPVDMLAVLVLDEKEWCCRILNLNRDTMLEMPMLNDQGREDGTFFGQLAFSHTYGRGGEDSCENTRKTVSNFLYGMIPDYYLAMNLDAVSLLTDAVGGVTVQVQDDFSQVDPSIPMGTVTLQGPQALSFVQSRSGVGDELNLSRMERQQTYMNAFVKAFVEKQNSSDTFLLKTYDALAPYLVSDLPVNTLTSLMERCQGYVVETVISLEGENVLGEQYYEFYPDETQLEALILELFYAPK